VSLRACSCVSVSAYIKRRKKQKYRLSINRQKFVWIKIEETFLFVLTCLYVLEIRKTMFFYLF